MGRWIFDKGPQDRAADARVDAALRAAPTSCRHEAVTVTATIDRRTSPATVTREARCHDCTWSGQV